MAVDTWTNTSYDTWTNTAYDEWTPVIVLQTAEDIILFDLFIKQDFGLDLYIDQDRKQQLFIDQLRSLGLEF